MPLNKNIFLLALLLVNFCYSQSYEVAGKITDDVLKPIANANIVFRSLEDGKIITYLATDNEGHYSVMFAAKSNKIEINITHISYAKRIDTIALLSAKTIYDQVLQNSAVNLTEIVIVPKFTKDTMKISTNKLNLNNRSTLRDILNKTDGFNVSNDGGITFQGKSINKVLINKKEVFINQNKIALDNLDYEMMDDLELINNYKDQFDIDFGNINSSVINVNTKKEFKGILKISGDAGGGYKDKFLLKLRGLFFSDKLNAFAIHNTNNIGKSELGFKDVSFAFKTNASSFLKENLASFFSEDDLLKKSFVSNTSLTLRKESKKTRFGAVIYYNNIDFTKTTLSETRSTDKTLLKEEENRTTNHGNSLIASLNFVRAINKNSLLFFKSNNLYSENSNTAAVAIQNYLPLNNSSAERNSQNPYAALTNNALSFKQKLSEKNILNIGVEHTFEKSDQRFNSEFKSDATDYSAQSYTLKNNYSNLFLDLERKTSEETWAGIGISSSFMNESLAYNKSEKRNLNRSEIKFQFSGKNNSVEFEVNAIPQLYTFYSENNQTETTFKSNVLFKYIINQNKTLNLDFDIDNQLADLYKNIDTLQISFNNRLINTDDIKSTIARNTNIGLGYYYSNMIKSQSLRVSFAYSTDHNYLQPIFQTIQDNVFYYTNKIIDKKQTYNYSIAGSKGYYINKNYDLFRIKGSYGYTISKSPTFVESLERAYNSENQNITASVGFESKTFFLNEIAVSAALGFQKIFLDDTKINAFESNVYSVDFIKKNNDFEFNLSVGKKFNRTSGNTFGLPFLNLYTNVKITEKLNIFLRGKYLFHLFGFPDTEITDLNIASDGNLIYKNHNQNILNYLLVGLSFKL